MICPCCGQPVSPPGRLQALLPDLGPVSAALLRELMAADRPLDGRALADRVYRGAVDGGPGNAPQVISLAFRKMRPRVEALGWTIRAEPGRGYRLAPVGA